MWWDATKRTQLAVINLVMSRVCSMLAVKDTSLWLGLGGGRVVVMQPSMVDGAPACQVQKDWKYESRHACADAGRSAGAHRGAQFCPRHGSLAPGRAHQTDTMHLESVVDDTGGTVVVSGSENGGILMWDGDLIEDRVSTWRLRLSGHR